MQVLRLEEPAGVPSGLQLHANIQKRTLETLSIELEGVQPGSPASRGQQLGQPVAVGALLHTVGGVSTHGRGLPEVQRMIDEGARPLQIAFMQSAPPSRVAAAAGNRKIRKKNRIAASRKSAACCAARPSAGAPPGSRAAPVAAANDPVGGVLAASPAAWSDSDGEDAAAYHTAEDDWPEDLVSEGADADTADAEVATTGPVSEKDVRGVQARLSSMNAEKLLAEGWEESASWKDTKAGSWAVAYRKPAVRHYY